MSERLDKAITAIEDAKEADHNPELQTHLLGIANVLASIDAAEKLGEAVSLLRTIAGYVKPNAYTSASTGRDL